MIIEFCNKTGTQLIAQRMWEQAPKRGDIVCLHGLPDPHVVAWVSWVDKDEERIEPIVRCAIEKQTNKGSQSPAKK